MPPALLSQRPLSYPTTRQRLCQGFVNQLRGADNSDLPSQSRTDQRQTATNPGVSSAWNSCTDSAQALAAESTEP